MSAVADTLVLRPLPGQDQDTCLDLDSKIQTRQNYRIRIALLVWQDRIDRRSRDCCGAYLSHTISNNHLLCEWDPIRDLPAFLHRTIYHGNAEYIAGSGSRSWRVCLSCARRPALMEAATTPGSTSRLKIHRLRDGKLVSDFNGKIVAMK